MNPFELRRVNALRVGSTTATGQALRESAGLVDCLDWVEKRVQELEAGEPPAEGKVAWGMAAAYKNTGFGGGVEDAAGAEVEVYPDGTAEIRSSSADLGQGLATILAQTTAEELGLPFERVRVLLSDTDLTPDGGATTASRQTYVTGNAARLAARSMRERLASVAAERWDVPPNTIFFESEELRAGEHVTSMGEAVRWLQEEGHDTRLTYRYVAPQTLPLGQGGDMHVAYSYGVQAAQVAVNQEKGKVTVLRLVAANDSGRALNPRALVGQVEGSMVMGIGTALTEEYVLENGVPRTVRWQDYDAPRIAQVPEMEVGIVEHPISTGPYGAKGIGELPSIPTAPAICNAIYNAIGVRAYHLPVRPEWLLQEIARLRGS
jgi:CO/xanthine dehydrogenase Mo-binding subunit